MVKFLINKSFSDAALILVFVWVGAVLILMLALRENTVAFNKPEVVIMSFEQVQID